MAVPIANALGSWGEAGEAEGKTMSGLPDFDTLPIADRTRALAAVREAFAEKGCRSIQEWAAHESLTPQAAWEVICRANDIPICRLPSRLQVN
jgi:hypothetical protein